VIKCDGDNVEKILATLVSLVIALARESLYIKKKLDLEVTILMKMKFIENQRTLAPGIHWMGGL